MNKELLFSITKKDFIFEAIRGSGPGGQHRNKSHTGIRITHKASGASIAATDSKSQSINKRNAFSRLIKSKKFKSWLQIECAKYSLNDYEIEKWLNEQMLKRNLKIEYIE